MNRVDVVWQVIFEDLIVCFVATSFVQETVDFHSLAGSQNAPHCGKSPVEAIDSVDLVGFKELQRILVALPCRGEKPIQQLSVFH